jgi:hypothetical protein
VKDQNFQVRHNKDFLYQGISALTVNASNMLFPDENLAVVLANPGIEINLGHAPDNVVSWQTPQQINRFPQSKGKHLLGFITEAFSKSEIIGWYGNKPGRRVHSIEKLCIGQQH